MESTYEKTDRRSIQHILFYYCLSFRFNIFGTLWQLMKIKKTMVTHNHCGVFHWFDIDGEIYVLLVNGNDIALLDSDHRNITAMYKGIYYLLINFI